MARKILLADDSVTAQNMGRKILSDAGYEVITVNNGSAALKKIAEQRPDLIVLDVYMPGYSGLEVCQRIKETKETSRIPILLTVGKLEPFKPEEARRARADAYIVKPFEASELLVALTKLEDKIVPQAEPYKPGRFAKAIAAVERFNQAEAEERFGDKDSGWKNRIKFPSPGSRPPEPEPEEVSAKKDFRDEDKPSEPNREFERPIPEGLPKDITAEEIQAISAAAAQFSENPEAVFLPDLGHGSTPESEVHEHASAPQSSEPVTAAVSHQQVEAEIGRGTASTDAEPPEPQHDELPVTFAGSAETQHQGQAETQAEARDTRESEPVVPPSQTSDDGDSGDGTVRFEKATTQFTAPPPGSQEAAESAVPSALDRQDSTLGGPDSDVVAALQNLTPGKTNGATSTSTAQTGSAEAIGPRWVVEPVSIDALEASLALEEEMHKALAAFAAAEGAKAIFAGADAAGARSNEVNSSWDQPHTSAVSEQPALTNHASGYGSHSASDSVAHDASESLSTLPESQAEPSAPPSTISSDEANIGTSSEAVGSEERAQSISDVKDGGSESASAPEPGETAAKAAAWENWQHIRDTVMGETTDLTNVAPAPATSSSSDEPSNKPDTMAAAAGAGDNTSSAPDGDSSAIANIVDTVLAELKPRLMEEIARKMKKDSK